MELFIIIMSLSYSMAAEFPTFCDVQHEISDIHCQNVLLKNRTLMSTPDITLRRLLVTESILPRLSFSFFQTIPFITTMRLSNNSIEEVINDEFGLVRFPYLETLDLSYNKITNFSAVNLLENSTVKYLFLGGNYNLTVPDKEPIIVSGTLNELDLSNCGIKYVWPETFSKLPYLLRLYIRENSLTTLPLGAFDGTLLLLLDIRWNKFEFIDKELLRLKFFPSTFYLDGNPWVCDDKLQPTIAHARKNRIKINLINCEKPVQQTWAEALNASYYDGDLSEPFPYYKPPIEYADPKEFQGI